jgi:hypothetical protein
MHGNVQVRFGEGDTPYPKGSTVPTLPGDGKSSGEGVRGKRLTKARGHRGESDGAEESAPRKAGDPRMRTDGEGPSPSGRSEQRYPANAQAVHGELRVCWRNVKGRFMVFLTMEKDRRC